MAQGQHIEAEPIPATDDLRYLGVSLEFKLTWSLNTTKKVTKAKQAIGSLRRLRRNKLTLGHMQTLLTDKELPIFM